MKLYEILLIMSGRATPRELALAKEIDMLREEFTDLRQSVLEMEWRHQPPLPPGMHFAKQDQAEKFRLMRAKNIENPLNIS